MIDEQLDAADVAWTSAGSSGVTEWYDATDFFAGGGAVVWRYDPITRTYSFDLEPRSKGAVS